MKGLIVLPKFYKLYNIHSKSTIVYDELSDLMFEDGWRIMEELSSSQIDFVKFNILEREMQKEIYGY